MKNNKTGLEIAVVGMSGRFPGAQNVDEFWENLKKGVDSVSFYSDKELREMGIVDDILANPDFVKAKANLEGKVYFDSSFFGYIPEEARLMDPQTRIFHECVWSALEDAGINPNNHGELIGLFAGAGRGFEWEAYSILSEHDLSIDGFSVGFLRDKDNLPTRISYKLNLKGPAVSIKTTCSTSLVAIHLACRCLLLGDCRVALAGGVTLTGEDESGYIYREGMINSKDGHCAAFDADASGTVWGEGAAVVVLKRLKDAIEERDNIWAVIKGSAINNDGERKIGFTAPSVDGQAEVIRIAQGIARVEPQSVSYIESHGTGTALGDVIEAAALSQVFGKSAKQYCAVGSVKSNVGHLDAAAGAAGFIKTVLALKNRQVPPTLYFRKLNPKIDFKNRPFYVNSGLREWHHGTRPLRAGVSSFGIGGTNAHVILEEAPAQNPAAASRAYQVFMLSGRKTVALDRMTANLKNCLEKFKDINLADAAFTLQTGRKEFAHRRMFVCRDIEDALAILNSPGSAKIKTFKIDNKRKFIVFMFPGQGAQYENMGLELYRSEATFRDEIDRCSELFAPLLGFDLRRVLYPRCMDEGSKGDIDSTAAAQPILFAFEYALAKLMMAWGIKPDYMIGYSYGEYAAACLSGVISLKDAIELIVLRGQLMEKLPPGAMLSVPLTEEQLLPLLNKDLSLAIDNGPSCIVSGDLQAVADFEKQMKKKGLLCMKVKMSHASHSAVMEPILEEFEERVRGKELNKPRIPYISNPTGGWITEKQAVDPAYWSHHLRSTVRFAKGLDVILEQKDVIFVEVGPGKALSNMVRQQKRSKGERLVVNLVKNKEESVDDVYYLLERVGRLWLYGRGIDWRQFYAHEKRCKVSLPTYPFDRIKYPIGGNLLKFLSRGESAPLPLADAAVSDWFYIPTWKRTCIFKKEEPERSDKNSIILIDDNDLGMSLLEKLEPGGGLHTIVTAGEGYRNLSEASYVIDPTSQDNYDRLFRELSAKKREPERIIHMWGASTLRDDSTGIETTREAQRTGFYSLLCISRALRKLKSDAPKKIFIVTTNLLDVTGDELLHPGQATVLGFNRVAGQEFPYIRSRCIDITLPQNGEEKERLLTQLLTEFSLESVDNVVAYRGSSRWVEFYEPVKLEKSDGEYGRLKKNGVYLITGGMGEIGFQLAEHFARQFSAKCVLTGRSRFPRREEWEGRAAGQEETDDETAAKIRKIVKLEKSGAEFLILEADAADYEQMSHAVSEAEKRFGKIDGVVHAAGIVAGHSIPEITAGQCEVQFQAKVYGLFVLEKVLANRELDFCFLLSSLSSVLGGLGFVAYSAANLFMDVFARCHNRRHSTLWTSINWEGMDREKGGEAFGRIFSLKEIDQVVVSLGGNLQDRIDKWIKSTPEILDNAAFEDNRAVIERPDFITEYVKPSTPTEETLAEIWQRFFGIEKIGINDDFFELGGDSLKAMTMSARIYKELNVEASVLEFFNKPTIKQLAAYVDTSAKGEFVPINSAEKKEYYEVSSAQRRLYVLQQMNPGDTNYNEYQLIVLREDTDTDKLERTLKELMARHESLRTSFKIIGEEPVQLIAEEVDFSVEYIDESSPEESVIDNFVRPFDLSRAPLLRVGIRKTIDEKYILIFDSHHIIMDGISRIVIEKEFLSIYNGVECPFIRLHYKDFTVWQNSERQQELLRQNEAYWVNLFSGEIPVLNLPIDYPRPIMQSFEGATVSFVLDEVQTSAIRKIGQENDATLYMTILTIFNILLSKLSGQEDLIVGTPSGVRPHADLESIVGMFVNTLALRSYPFKEKTFTGFLDDVKKSTIKAFENQEYRFEDLVDRISVRRDTGHNPIFDVLFNMMNQEDHRGGMTWDNEAGHYVHRKSTAKFDLSLTAFDYNRMIYIELEYCTKLYTPGSIERLIGYLKGIVNRVISGPALKIGDIEIISQSEKKQVLADFNDTQCDYPRDKTLHELFDKQAEKIPGHIALVGKEASAAGMNQVSYKELSKRSSRLARLLSARGVIRDVIVGMMPERSVEMVVCIFGILKSGGAYLPIDGDYPKERVRFMLEDSGSELLLTHGDFLRMFADICETIDVYDVDSYAIKKRPLPKAAAPENLAYLTYTSGSTGKPKGVMINHRSVVNFIKGVTDVIDFTVKDVILSLTTICFDIFGLETILPLLSGSRVVVGSREEQLNPRAAGSALSNFDVSILQVTPSRLTMQVEDEDFLRGLKKLGCLLVGGEAFPGSLLGKVRELTNCKIYNMYGPTETTIWSAMKDVSGKELLNIGKPISNTSIYIVDSGYHLQPVGVTGELCIAGDGLSPGYVNRPELTAEKFIKTTSNKSFVGSRGGFSKEPLAAGGKIYRTGDLARWLPDGNIDFLGRIDQQVKLRGFRIELEEIERIVSEHEEIKESLVLLKGDGDENRYLCAYIVPASDNGDAPSYTLLREYVSQFLPDYMVPSYFVPIDKIPLTPNGKIDRKVLPDPEIPAGEEFVAPKNEQEERLVEIWAEVLALDKELIGVNSNFFEIGGNSLRIINVNNLIKERFNRDISIALMFRFPTIKTLASHLIGFDITVQVSDKTLDESMETVWETMNVLSERQ